ncbi:MAG: SDR family oxidoreductase [Betaproteobacteria bacterium]|nr:SDR family oxidoreductase [Betaproteobacteria bacterium]
MQVFTQFLDGKNALVVGGTSGIGAAIGRALAQAGARVTVTGATEAGVRGARQSVDFGTEIALQLDVTDAAAVKALIGGFSSLQVLINSAGTTRRGGVEHDPEIFDQILDINLSGTMRVGSAARHMLAASSGCIVNTASMLSFFGAPLVPAYSASKGGVAQLTKSLAIAYAADNIRVNAIAPGWIQTPLTRPLYTDDARSRAILERTPMNRWGQPEDIAGAVVFLCSPAARFLTGVILPVDGGYLIT